MKDRHDRYWLGRPDNKTAFCQGLRDGLPIGLGYFVVSFSLGIAAKNAGLSPFQGLIASFLCNTSAGEYIGFTLIAAGATYLEVAFMTLVANARYLLMSTALSQRIRPETGLRHRMLMVYVLSDEIFAATVRRDGYLNPNYTYGVMLAADPFWVFGTFFGCLAGNIMPLCLVSALGVALFGMFLAVIVPPMRTNKVIAGVVAICFAASFAAAVLPGLSGISGGSRTILLTVVISAAAALFSPESKKRRE